MWTSARVPLGAALGREHDHVVGEPEPAGVHTEGGEQFVLAAGEVIGAGRGRDELWVLAQPAGLRAGLVERERQRDHLAVTNERGGVADLLGADEVQRAELVVLAPLSQRDRRAM
jgi:hypothetical protein